MERKEATLKSREDKHLAWSRAKPGPKTVFWTRERHPEDGGKKWAGNRVKDCVVESSQIIPLKHLPLQNISKLTDIEDRLVVAKVGGEGVGGTGIWGLVDANY